MQKYVAFVVIILGIVIGIFVYSLTLEQHDSEGFYMSMKPVIFQWVDFFRMFRGAYAEAGTYRTDEARLLARLINGEARGEPYVGQVAVGAVVLNRVKHPKFPKTIAGVIYQPGAFTAVTDGQINLPISPQSTAYKAARDALNGWDPTGGCIYYFNPATATSRWIWSRPIVTKIGKHYFTK